MRVSKVCLFLLFWILFGGQIWLLRAANKSPSLTFARPEQIAKYLAVDQELLLCRIYFISAMPITKYFSAIQISWHFYPPFYLDPCGAYNFSKFLGGCKVERL